MRSSSFDMIENVKWIQTMNKNNIIKQSNVNLSKANKGIRKIRILIYVNYFWLHLWKNTKSWNKKI